MLIYKKRAQVGCIELWVSTTWSHWKYAQFRRSTDGSVIYDQNTSPLIGGMKDLYKRFQNMVTLEMATQIENFNSEIHDKNSDQFNECMKIRNILRKLVIDNNV